MKPLEPDESCLIEPLIAAISGKWKLLIVYWLAQSPVRFNQLQRNLGSITHRTLTRQLNELQEAGFVARKDFMTIPPHAIGAEPDPSAARDARLGRDAR